MDNIAHIGLVDTHTKSDGCDDDINSLVEEGILVVGTGLGIHTSVISQGLDAVGYEQFGQLLDLLTAQAVDNAALAVVLLDKANDVVVYIVLGA